MVHKCNSGYDVVLIGASTGGPRAIEEVVEKFTLDLNIIVLIVQHMPRGFTKSFAERLNKKCELEVVEACNGDKLEINKVYIAPGGFHMEIGKNHCISLNEDPLIWGVRPAVDKLFISAANIYKSRVISVVLTGMGKDGANGTEIVKLNKGITIAQDQETSTIYGMPRVTYETGTVDFVLPLNKVAEQIRALVTGS